MSELKFGADGFPKVSFVKHVESFHSGGGCMLDLVTLFNGTVVCVSDECVTVHKDLDAFWADEGDAAIIWYSDLATEAEIRDNRTPSMVDTQPIQITELGELL